MDDPNLEKVQRRALLTITPDGNAQLEKELIEEKRHNESLQRISALEKIAGELRESNKFAIKQAQEAEKSARFSNGLAIGSLVLSAVSIIVSVLLHFLG